MTMLKRNTQKLYSVTLAMGMALMGVVPVFAADDFDALDTAANGVGAVGNGILTTVLTPVAVAGNMANGKVDDAIVSTVSMPIQGVLSATAGTVQIVSGIGGGLSQLGEGLFANTAKAAKQLSDDVYEESTLPVLLDSYSK